MLFPFVLTCCVLCGATCCNEDEQVESEQNAEGAPVRAQNPLAPAAAEAPTAQTAPDGAEAPPPAHRTHKARGALEAEEAANSGGVITLCPLACIIILLSKLLGRFFSFSAREPAAVVREQPACDDRGVDPRHHRAAHQQGAARPHRLRAHPARAAEHRGRNEAGEDHNRPHERLFTAG